MAHSYSLLRRATQVAPGLALAGAQIAAAQPAPPCLTEREVSSLVTYALPVVMDSAIRSCAPALSPQGYFATQGPSLVARYAARKPAAWPAAKAALFKLGGPSAGENDRKMRDMITSLPDDALQPFAEGMVAQMIAKEIKPGQCKAIERATMLLAPLPPENTADLVAFIVQLADQPKPGRKQTFAVCPAAADR